MFAEAAKKNIMGATGGVDPLATQQGQGGGLMSALMQRVGMDQANNPFNQGGLAQAMAHAAGGSPQAAQPQQLGGLASQFMQQAGTDAGQQAQQLMGQAQSMADPRLEKFRSMFGRDPVHPNELSLVS